MTSKFFVYILKTSEGTYYVGQTIDIKKRLLQHQKGKGSKYLRMFSKFDLVYKVEVESRSKALMVEHQLKQLTHSQKEEIITNPNKVSYSLLTNSIIDV